MLRQLKALCEEVRFVVLFDSVPPGKAEPPRGVALRNLAANIRRHGFGPLRPYISTQVKAWIHRFVPVNRYRAAEEEADKRELGMGDVHDLGFVNLFYYFSAAADR